MVKKDVEGWVSCAEIAWKEGRTIEAVRSAKRALECCDDTERRIALRIFIARAYSKMGKYRESNIVYRALIKEDIYIPPVIMGLLYNSFRANDVKIGRNVKLMKIFVR